jgi:hypothetical protein
MYDKRIYRRCYRHGKLVLHGHTLAINFARQFKKNATYADLANGFWYLYATDDEFRTLVNGRMQAYLLMKKKGLTNHLP